MPSRAVGTLALFSLTACLHGQPHPQLGAVLSRVDVPRLFACAGEPDWPSRARCLGAEVATQGLQIAFGKALEFAERARDADGPAGAADYTDDERAKLAAELDESLEQLALEVDAAGGAPE